VEDFIEVVGDVEGVFDFVSDVLCAIVADEAFTGVWDGTFHSSDVSNKFFRRMKKIIREGLYLFFSSLFSRIDIDR
jgi:hypothetical protein